MRTCNSLYLSLTLCLALTASRAFASPTGKELHTEAAVLAADDDWLAAELRGDVRALDLRLMPTYRDITLEGKVRTKQDLLEHAKTRLDKVTGPPLQVAADFRAKHPEIEHVLVVGDTAILQFESAKPEQRGVVQSIDVFVYQDRRWRGLYSAHSK
jgi:hypothetical protein